MAATGGEPRQEEPLPGHQRGSQVRAPMLDHPVEGAPTAPKPAGRITTMSFYGMPFTSAKNLSHQ